jgi:propionyl-CoA carboxylase alpha chain
MFPDGFKAPEPTGAVAERLAAVAAAIDHALNSRKRGISGQMLTSKAVVFESERVVILGSARYPVSVRQADGAISVALAGVKAREVVSGWRPGEPVWSGVVGGERIAVQVKPILNGVRLSHAGAETLARVYTRREAELAALMPEKKAADTSKALLCPMPGLVKSIAVVGGQEVKAGETLAVVEAMKMENVLRAERDVTVKALKAKAGDSLAVDAVIMEFA